MKNHTRNLTTCAIFAGIICVVTTFISVPAPAIGNINLGDVFILCAGWILGPWGALASGIGAGLADLFSGYAIYAPATFVIKALVSLTCYYAFKLLSKLFKDSFGNHILSRLLSALLAEAVMVLGYFVYESILYGITMAVASVPFNLIQGVSCLVLGTIICHIVANTSAAKFFINR